MLFLSTPLPNHLHSFSCSSHYGKYLVTSWKVCLNSQVPSHVFFQDVLQYLSFFSLNLHCTANDPEWLSCPPLPLGTVMNWWLRWNLTLDPPNHPRPHILNFKHWRLSNWSHLRHTFSWPRLHGSSAPVSLLLQRVCTRESLKNSDKKPNEGKLPPSHTKLMLSWDKPREKNWLYAI